MYRSMNVSSLKILTPHSMALRIFGVPESGKLAISVVAFSEMLSVGLLLMPLCVHFGPTAAAPLLGDNDLLVAPFFQFGDMGDDAHEAVAFSQSSKGIIGLCQCLGVQRAETFVYKERIQPDAGRHLHFVGQT